MRGEMVAHDQHASAGKGDVEPDLVVVPFLGHGFDADPHGESGVRFLDPYVHGIANAFPLGAFGKDKLALAADAATQINGHGRFSRFEMREEGHRDPIQLASANGSTSISDSCSRAFARSCAVCI